MMRRAHSKRRSPRAWAGRAAIALLMAVLGFASVTFSVAQVIAKRDPILAHGLASYDGRITAKAAMVLAGEEANAADRRRADDLARRALRQDATAVLALSTLGLNADLRGDKNGARRLFVQAQRQSRRDLRTQLWMIEDAVERGSIPEALKQYDRALRVAPQLGGLLYPVLATANAEPAIRRELVRTLAGRPSWGESFVSYASRSAPDRRAVAALFLDLRRAGVTVPQPSRAAVVDALIASGHVDEAWRYYALDHPGVDRRRSRDPRFSAGLATPSQFDWVPIDNAGVMTAMSDGIVDFTAPASTGGPLLRQLQIMPPGTYRLFGRSEGVDQAPQSRPYWTLQCQDGRELGRVPLPASAEAKATFAGMFNVPVGCPVQTLVLVAQTSDAMTGVSGRIDQAELVPLPTARH